jgi:hypothetical protein
LRDIIALAKAQKSESPQRREKFPPWRLRVKTFRKFFFMMSSRRLRVNQEQ